MNWTKERDLLISQTLISQTMAFVQSIGLEKADPDVRIKSRPEVQPIMKTHVLKVDQVPPSAEILPVANHSPVTGVGLREEIQSRVAAFRAHQQLFNRERDAYFHTVLNKARASGTRLPKPSGN